MKVFERTMRFELDGQDVDPPLPEDRPFVYIEWPENIPVYESLTFNKRTSVALQLRDDNNQLKRSKPNQPLILSIPADKTPTRCKNLLLILGLVYQKFRP
jgi:hypothetical protein